MKNYKGSTYPSNNYSSYIEKRKEMRKKAKMSSPIWSSPSTDENESTEDLYKSFFKSNLYFNEEENKKIQYEKEKEKEREKEREMEKEREKEREKAVEIINSIPDSRLESDDESISSNRQSKYFLKSGDSYLGKKTLRDEIDILDQYEPTGQESINNIDPLNILKSKPVEIKFNEREMRKIIQGTKIDKRELELFAPYVQKGKRIPRRGEVGLTSEAIENFEKLGYVMSGSRHKKMTSAREMKEKQIFTVEEKKALAIFNLEEQQRKEINIIDNFRRILKNKKGTEKDEEGFYKDEKESQQE